MPLCGWMLTTAFIGGIAARRQSAVRLRAGGGPSPAAGSRARDRRAAGYVLSWGTVTVVVQRRSLSALSRPT
jgi:hypothetical protein